jgi:hypothetical protein
VRTDPFSHSPLGSLDKMRDRDKTRREQPVLLHERTVKVDGAVGAGIDDKSCIDRWLGASVPSKSADRFLIHIYSVAIKIS